MTDEPARPAPEAQGPPVGVDSEVGPSNDDDRVWGALARWRAERRRFALLTVVESRGSAPRKAGVHMLLADTGETVGTIGGGAIEQVALGRAREVLAAGGPVLVRHDLTRDLGMCCGGEMSVFVEVVEPRPRLFVFGAGYVGRPLAAMAASCGFDVTVVDGRAEWAVPERFAGAAVLCQEPEDAARALDLRPDDYACVVTHDHALDDRVVQVLIRRPLRFLGMIGSLSKQRKFARRLEARGFGDEEIARLHTPLGLSIGAATPEEIAVSVVAQLVAERRGVAIDPGWAASAARAGTPRRAAADSTEAERP
ncbi:MAG TPA: xanthine dehydrogenase accessory protein XdhC [Terriglobales bacterium]|nr:xanthine dehydrogenase accessory protein XdhC [Terriglobales bacterium]